MYQTRIIGQLKLELFDQMKSSVAYSDFCAPAGTIEFSAVDGLLSNNFLVFRLTYPGYELEARINDGMVFVRRNGIYQNSEQYKGREKHHVAIQWNIDSIGCGIAPWSQDHYTMNHHMRAVHTPPTVPPPGLVRTLRTENLLINSAYKSADDLFVTVLDCLHLCELDIRRFGGQRSVWGKNGDAMHPLDEPEISRFVATFLASYGAARNFDVTCEPLGGSGKLDLWVVGPVQASGLAKVAIEAKKADHRALVRGFTHQLPEYMARLEASHGIFLTYWLKSPAYPYPRFASYSELETSLLHPLSHGTNVRTVGMNLSNGSTPSRT